MCISELFRTRLRKFGPSTRGFTYVTCRLRIPIRQVIIRFIYWSELIFIDHYCWVTFVKTSSVHPPPKALRLGGYYPVRRIQPHSRMSAHQFYIAYWTPINFLMQKFWENEEVFEQIPMTEEEKQCKEHFATIHTRSSQGRYVVHLPFRKSLPIKIGESLPIALSLYDRTEKRLQRRLDICV